MVNSLEISFPYNIHQPYFYFSLILFQGHVEHVCLVSGPGDKPRGKGRPAKSGGPAGARGVSCPVCAKVFNNSSALAKHKLTHSDERKYVCSVCSKAFKRQDHL